MKTGKKALLLALCAVLLVAASVLGTMAYLTSSAEVKNTFTVGNVAITMDEAKVTETGETVPTAPRTTENGYKLLPGHTYTKDPIIHVAATSEDCYLFVKVVNEIANIEADTKVADQMKTNGWIPVAGETGVYVYVKTADATVPAVAKAGENIKVFEEINISGTATNDALKAYDGKTIVVTAYAVQVDGFEGKPVADIWSAAKTAA